MKKSVWVQSVVVDEGGMREVWKDPSSPVEWYGTEGTGLVERQDV